MRLDKFLVIFLIGRRKDVRSYIKEGMVKVNGNLIIEFVIEIDENFDVIEYFNKVVIYIGKVYYMFNKFVGCVIVKRDDVNKIVFDYFKDVNMEGIFYVGRLDKDIEGLFLLINDGEFEYKLMYLEKYVEKMYYFWVLGFLDEDDIRKLKEGFYI